MKVTITIDRKESAHKKSNTLQKINKVLGSKATISGDAVTVNSGNDEKRVVECLGHEKVNYARSCH